MLCARADRESGRGRQRCCAVAQKRLQQFGQLYARFQRCLPLSKASHAIAGFSRDERGSYLTIVGLLAPLVGGIAGLGSEYGVWVHRHQVLQSAADSAAISAAVALSND